MMNSYENILSDNVLEVENSKESKPKDTQVPKILLE
jgi:hypothetical protein